MTTPYKQCGIYAVIHTPSGRAYIGQSVNLRNRWYIHRYKLSKGEHHNTPLQNAWSKYGKDAFEFRLLELVQRDVEALRICEQKWLDGFKLSGEVFNTAMIAGSCLGIKISLETRTKMMESWRARDDAGLVKRTKPRARTQRWAQMTLC